VDLSPIDCQHVLQQIELYLDGELEASLRVEVHQHLSGCNGCTDHSAFQQRLKELLRAKCGCNDVPAQVLERIQAMLAGGPEPLHPA
jgi:mycothiol system anti-sigma-R factor